MTPTDVVAVVAVITTIGLGIALYVTRRRQVSISDSAGELAELHRAGAREKSEADLALAVAAGGRAVVEADAAAEREVARAGSLADHLRDLGSD